jgi:hypothetical protein
MQPPGPRIRLAERTWLDKRSALDIPVAAGLVPALGDHPSADGVARTPRDTLPPAPRRPISLSNQQGSTRSAATQGNYFSREQGKVKG